jgi:hypothetical protein
MCLNVGRRRLLWKSREALRKRAGVASGRADRQAALRAREAASVAAEGPSQPLRVHLGDGAARLPAPLPRESAVRGKIFFALATDQMTPCFPVDIRSLPGPGVIRGGFKLVSAP